MWTKNFQMYKLDLERQRNQRSNCQHPFDHKKGKRIPEKKNLLCFIDYVKAFDCVDHGKLWKILKEMGIPDHLICLMWNWYAGPEAIVRTGHETTAWFQIGKGILLSHVKAVYCHSAYFTYMQSTSREMPGWMKHKPESKLQGDRFMDMGRGEARVRCMERVTWKLTLPYVR